MDVLKQLIDSMSKEELRHFKMFLASGESKMERKDIKLFDFYKKNEDPDDGKIFNKLYTLEDRNPFYRLKNRLQEDVGLSLMVQHSDKDETNNLYKNLSLFQLFYAKQHYSLAAFYLKKAERKAVQVQNLEMLDLIYANFIKLSNDFMEVNPEVYIEKRAKNAGKLNKIRNMDQLLAALNYRLKTSQNYNTKDKDLLKILERTTKEFSLDDSTKSDKSFQTRIYRAISSVMVQQHNFKELEVYAVKSFEDFNGNGWFDRVNHELKLQMLIYIINSKFYNQKYHEALQYVELLSGAMEEYDKVLYEKYLFFLFNSYVVNYSQTNFDRALSKLDEFERLMRKRKNNYYDQFIFLNKATLLFEIKKYNDAVRNLMKLYVSPAYEKIDSSFRLKIEVAELIMQYESGDFLSLKKRTEQVRKKHTELNTKEFYREKKVLQILEQLSEEGRIKTTSKAFKDMLNFIKEDISPAIEEGEIIKYRYWMKGKIESINK